MAEATKVWVKTTTIETVLYGKSKSAGQRRALPDGLSDLNDAENKKGVVNWGWHRAELIRDLATASASKKKKGGVNDDIVDGETPVKVYVKDDESAFNRETIEIPADLAREGGVVMDNVWADEDDEDEDYDEGDFVSKEGPPDDLIHLTHLHEPAVVYCLRRRYAHDKIYTATGPILLALNPFKNCQHLYSEKIMKQYARRGEYVALMSGSKGTGVGEDDDDDEGEDGGKKKKKVVLNTDEDLPPHVYSIADHSFRSMMKAFDDSGGSSSGGGRAKAGAAETITNQSILVSGESGAGKTVTTKFIMKYLASLSQMAEASVRNLKAGGRTKPSAPAAAKHGSTEQQVLQSNPILESFGNARTIRNDNSSRFGKFIELEFTGTGNLIGASIETYLLEKVRLVTQTPGERNYHIFYELLAGMEEEELERYCFPNDVTAEDFRMTSMSGTYDRRDGVDDYDTYGDLMEAMDTMKFDPKEKENCLTVTCALLHCSNLDFVSLSADESAVDREHPALDPILSLLGVTADDLNQAMCYFSIVAGKEKHYRSVPKAKAEKGMEGLIKATYGALFTWIVKRINSSITVKDASSARGGAAGGGRRGGPKGKATVGVLDIFGFESFKKNSFEQLCINYCNEALQQQFNLFVLKNEQEEYEREGIQWSFISFPENQDVLDLIWKKGAGILNILDDQCRAPGTTDKTFATDVYNKCTGHPRFEADFRQVGARLFGVFHYAGPVEYDTEGFVEKNRDELPKEATDLLKSSTNEFVRQLADIVSGDGGGGASKSAAGGAAAGGAGARRRPVSRAGSGAASGGGGGGGGRGGSSKQTVGSQFSSQLSELRSKIDLTMPHYVRCLKPNDLLVPDHFDPAIIADQLRCAGVVEAVRVSRVGYPQRYPHSNFVKRYRILGLKELKKAARAGSTRRTKTCDILVAAIAKQIWKIQNPDDEEDEAPPNSKSKAKGKASATSKKDDIDLVQVGIQVGKTKVFLRSTAYEIMEKLRSAKMDEACVLIQSIGRGYVARREYQLTGNSVVALQCAVRQMYAREEFRTLKINHAAAVLQKSRRKQVLRREYVATLYAARWIAKVQRGKLGRRRYDALNRERKAGVIQTSWRRYYSSKQYGTMLRVTVALQREVRCHFARSELRELKAQAKNLGAVADERDALKQEVQRMRDEISAARKKAKEEAARAREMEKQFEADKKALVDTGEVDELKKELEVTKVELEKAKQIAEEEGARAEKAESSLQSASEDLERQKKETQNALADMEATKASAAKGSEQVSELMSTIDTLKGEVKEIEGQAAAAKEDAEANAKEVEALQEEIEELRNAPKETVTVEVPVEVPVQAAAAVSDGGGGGASVEELEKLQDEIDDLRAQLEDASEGRDRVAKEAERKLKNNQREMDALQGELDSAQKQLEAMEEELDEARREAEEGSSADRKAASVEKIGEKPQSYAPSMPNGDGDPLAEIEYLRSEVMRLEDELTSTKGVIDDPNSPAHLKARYDELFRLSNACLAKDEEIQKLTDKVKSLEAQLKEVNANGSVLGMGGPAASTTDPETTTDPELKDAEGDDDVKDEDDEEADDTSSLGFDDVTTPNRDPFISFRRKGKGGKKDAVEAEDDSALKAVNVMLRNEVESLRKELEETQEKAKSEAEQSAKDLEAFSEALRGVDEMRRAAEQMSRELNRMRKKNRRSKDSDQWETMSMRDDISMVSGGTEIFKEATRIIDKSNRQANNATHLWARVRNHVGGGERQRSRPVGDLGPVQEGGRRRGRRWGRGDDDAGSA